ncbi:hypothetical protein [Allocoleopsis sp.]|uniref:hypothetical protein n=1 Tax=Allocoleopsis sp. TaxID=3088169 RepID=UPI002FD2B545
MPNDPTLDSRWEDLGGFEQSVHAAQDDDAYQDFASAERELQADQHDEDIRQAFAPPEY